MKEAHKVNFGSMALRLQKDLDKSEKENKELRRRLENLEKKERDSKPDIVIP